MNSGQKVVEYLRSNPGSTQNDITVATRVSPAAVNLMLQAMEALGVLEMVMGRVTRGRPPVLYTLVLPPGQAVESGGS